MVLNSAEKRLFLSTQIYFLRHKKGPIQKSEQAFFVLPQL